MAGLGQRILETSFARLKNIKDRVSRTLNIEKIEHFLDAKWHNFDLSLLFVFAMIMLYTFVFSYFTILKYNAFRAFAWDLGIFNQSFWTTLHGKLFYSTIELFIIPSGIFFGTHFSPILFLILPIYAIRPAPETLLIFQSFILALGALPLYQLARNSLNNKLAGVIFATTYLLYPPLHGVNWFDFHVQIFLPLFFLSAIYYLEKGKLLRYFFFIVLALAVAENVATVTLFFGLYCLWRFRRSLYSAISKKKLHDRKIMIPIITIGMGISWFFIVRWVQGTFFPVNPSFYQIYKALDNWRVLGVEVDPITIPVYMLLNPTRVLEALSYDAYLKLLYVLLIFGPLLLKSLRSSMALITLAWFLPALLSNYSPYYVLGAHYPAYVIPFVFAAAVKALEKSLSVVQTPNFRGYLRNILVLAFLSSLFISPLSPLIITSRDGLPYFSDYSVPTYGTHQVLLQKAVNLVPSDASVLTHNNIFPHFSGRINAYAYPLDWMIQESTGDEMKNYIEELFSNSEYVMTDNLSDPYTTNLILPRIQNAGDYGLYAYGDGIYLYKKNYHGDAILLEP